MSSVKFKFHYRCDAPPFNGEMRSFECDMELYKLLNGFRDGIPLYPGREGEADFEVPTTRAEATQAPYHIPEHSIILMEKEYLEGPDS